MKILVIVLSALNGGYMLIDGIYVLLKGKYIGPPKPGPWSIAFNKLGIDVFKLGPLFIVLGCLWLLFIYGLLTNQQWSYLLGVCVSIATLWYLPFGTLCAVIILIVLFTARNKLGI